MWIIWSVLFSVDCFGEDGYINTRAWMLFSPFFVSWHMLVVRAVLWFSAPIALVYAPINRFLRGTGESDFFCHFSSRFIPSLGCLLTCVVAFYYPATLISISPRSSPRYPRHDRRGGSWLRYG